jgi:branched-chain amino acid transport system ATP-binding protein
MILEIKDVTKSFGGLIAVNKMNLVLEKDRIYGLLGPNGAGKTTLFNIISGFYRADSGSIVFAGKETSGLTTDKLCSIGLARTFQIPQVFAEMSTIDNITIGALNRTDNLNVAKSEAERIVKFMGMSRRKDALAGSLTVHELKRLEIAKALATKPKLLLLDETMAGLNIIEQQQVIELLKEVHDSGITLLLVEHVMHAIATLCEQIWVMHYGRKIAQGRPQDVLKNEEVVKVYLGE